MIQNYKTKSEKIQALRVIGDDAIQKINQDKQSWRKFLDFNAKFYKYAFSEALLIYAQDPNATMCGEVKHWNKIGRNIHKGTKGTAIFNETDLKSDLRYIFDVSNTYGKDDKLNRNIALSKPYYDSVLQQLKKQTATDFPTDNFPKNFKWAVEEYVRENSLEYLEGIQYSEFLPEEQAKTAQSSRRRFLSVTDLANSKFENIDIEEVSNQFINTVVDSVGYMVCEKLNIEKGLYDNDDLAFEHLENFNTKQMISRLGIATNHLSKNVLQIVTQTIISEMALEKERGIGNDSRNEQQQNQRNAINDSGTSERNSVNDGRGNNRGASQSTERQEPTTRQIRKNGMEISEGGKSHEIQQSSVKWDDVSDLPTSGLRRTGTNGGTTKTNESENPTSKRGLYGNMEIRNEYKGRGGSNSSRRNSVQDEITENQETHEESPNGDSFLTQENEMLIKSALTNESVYPDELHESIYKIFFNDDFSFENKADTLFALYQHCNIDSVIKLKNDNFIFDFDNGEITVFVNLKV